MPKRDLLSIDDLTRADVELLLDTAESFLPVLERDIKKVPTLRGRTIINLFYESSTAHARRASTWPPSGSRPTPWRPAGAGSAVEKGESLKDTTLTLSAYSPDIIVMRHPSAGACQLLSANTAASVINAGDGKHQHPTQCLLDLFTLRQSLGRELDGTQGLHRRRHPAQPRRAQRHHGLPACWAWTSRWSAPPTLMPRGIEEMGVKVEYDLANLKDADVVYLLRMQTERMQAGRQLHPLAARVRAALRHHATRGCGRGRRSCTPAPSTAASRSRRTSPTTAREPDPPAGRQRPRGAHGDPLPHHRRLQRRLG